MKVKVTTDFNLFLESISLPYQEPQTWLPLKLNRFKVGGTRVGTLMRSTMEMSRSMSPMDTF